MPGFFFWHPCDPCGRTRKSAARQGALAALGPRRRARHGEPDRAGDLPALRLAHGAAGRASLSLTLSHGSGGIFVTRPISAMLLGFAVIAVTAPLWTRFFFRAKTV